ncbi:MAG: PLP-dependent cysteine synthase family protein [Pseudoclavibacter sp.]
MTKYETLLDTIGGTPLVRLPHLDRTVAPRIYAKLDFQNPGGSSKDRAALWMIRRAEEEGLLSPGGTVVETTSGNTGIGIALVAAHLGYRSVIFTSAFIAEEKRRILVAYGAELRLVSEYLPKSHPRSAHSQAKAFVEETPGAWLATQFDNPSNPRAHVESTAPEIWRDTEGAVTHFVAPIGTGGTISGTGRTLKDLSGGAVRVIGADPQSSLYSGGDGSSRVIEGTGRAVHAEGVADPWPTTFDVGVVDEFVRVGDAEAIAAARRAALEEGLLVGGSAGLAIAAALRVASRLGPDDLIVVFIPDSGRNYLTTYFDDDWLTAQGFRDEAAARDGGESVREAIGPLDPSGVPRLAKHLQADAARRLLETRGIPEGVPVLVVEGRSAGEHPLSPGDVLGVLTLRRLAHGLDNGEFAASTRLDELTHPAPPRIGIGSIVDSAAEHLTRAQPDWALASVLSEGRIVALVDRATLLGHRRTSGETLDAHLVK